MLSVDLKIISDLFAARLKTVLPSSISSEQRAYIEKRFIDESGRLISEILNVTNNLKIKSYLVTMDIEKAFDSLDDTLHKKWSFPLTISSVNVTTEEMENFIFCKVIVS